MFFVMIAMIPSNFVTVKATVSQWWGVFWGTMEAWGAPVFNIRVLEV